MPGTNDSRTPSSSLRASHVRTAALAAAVVGVVVLPIAAAQATPSHGAKQTTATATGTAASGAPATATAQLPQFCGASETGFQGQVTEQPCVDDAAGSVTGIVYVGNASAKPLTVAINLTRADGSIAQMQCTIAAHDANGTCVTGALRETAGKGAFNAIVEAIPVGAPVALGVLHAESGQVNPNAGGADSGATGATGAASPSAAASATTSPAA